MTGKQLHLFIALSLFLASTPARADFTSDQPSPLERFTKSMVTVYVTAEMCKQISTLHTENYVTIIKNYMYSQFQDQAPYWVLPVVNKRIDSRERCVYSMEEGVSRYTEDSKDYAEYYPGNPPPPVLNDSMMLDNRSYPNQTNGESGKEHFLTPSVLVK